MPNTPREDARLTKLSLDSQRSTTQTPPSSEPSPPTEKKARNPSAEPFARTEPSARKLTQRRSEEALCSIAPLSINSTTKSIASIPHGRSSVLLQRALRRHLVVRSLELQTGVVTSRGTAVWDPRGRTECVDAAEVHLVDLEEGEALGLRAEESVGQGRGGRGGRTSGTKKRTKRPKKTMAPAQMKVCERDEGQKRVEKPEFRESCTILAWRFPYECNISSCFRRGRGENLRSQHQ